MFTQKEKNDFLSVAESLKKYRRADLLDQDGRSILDRLYVDLLDGDIILNKCLLDNTTFLIGRKGTGKSTIFLKLENEYRKKKGYLPCYIDVKTIYESSQTIAANYQYLSEYLDDSHLRKYLIARNFIQSVLKRIYDEIDKQSLGFIEKIRGSLGGNSVDDIKEEIQQLNQRIDDNSSFKSIEIPILQQIKSTVGKSLKNNNQITSSRKVGIDTTTITLGIEKGISDCSEVAENKEDELTSLCMKVFEIKKVISDIKFILGKMHIKHLVIMLDDVSEIDNDAIRLFIDTIVAPLNNWSEEFIKFKVAFYPNRVHYGKIDHGKIDKINLDFYNLYSEFDANKMEENAVNFTSRLLRNRFDYYTDGIERYFDGAIEDVDQLFFRVSMNVPRIIGHILSYLHQSKIIYDKKITKSDIENASVKYYNEKIEAFFNSSTYCLLSIDEKRDIFQLEKIRNAIVEKAKDIKKQIVTGTLTGSLYQKSNPYSSHFHILQENDKYTSSLELNHFITKYEERSNRDGKIVNIYCLNYGLAKKNNILWGKPKGTEFRTYFIERPFNYTELVLEQIREIKVIQCTNPDCRRIFEETDLEALKLYGYKCPSCLKQVVVSSRVDDEVNRDWQQATLPAITKDELKIILELYGQEKLIFARDIASEVDMSSQRVAKICKKLDEEKGLVVRVKDSSLQLFEYKISSNGEKYCVKKSDL
ncbi:hypothetical protein [uncultured Allofournierella sp.]|uniref:hypothetical protein n=1 Tax=uncultured Allofournierella sp. TaxID=1940258 RepID=UPI0025D4AE88|nr:hypothetical protein [uncultured Fournierella sp.]